MTLKGNLNKVSSSTRSIFFLFFLLTPFSSQALVQDVSRSSQLDVNVTLYPQEMALIKEKRTAFVKEGINKLLIKDVPSSILMDTFLFQVLPPSLPLTVLEYTFQAAHITREELLQRSVGDMVQLLGTTATPTSAKLLALDGDDAIVEAMDIIFAIKKNRVAFPHLPYTLVPEALITLKVTASKEEESLFEMGYLTKGFSWDAAYTIIVDSTGHHLDLNNWITVRNQSGVDIKNGHFRIAHTQQTNERFYEIEHPISVANQSTKNISWFAARNLTPANSLRIYPKNNIIVNEEGVVMKPPVETWLSVQNEASKGLGVPLPEGTIKVFKRNPDGSLFYIGENKTSPILLEKSLSLRLGTTKEITAEMRQTDYRKLGAHVVESGYRLDLKNTTDSPKQVMVFQNVSGEWVILRETHSHDEDEKRLKWTLSLAPQEEVSLRYRIRMNVQ
ncbi:MAG: DUF4139 domain-containing protein [Proteobacteria bacterium]|nr:DUF4139 domain-containing protein [Pseudomonadota bacterium]